MKAHKSLDYACLPPRSEPQPWLLMSHGPSAHGHLFYNPSEDRCYHRSIPQLRGKLVHYNSPSSQGWMILQDLHSRDGCSLFNVPSMEVIQLPRVDFDWDNCILSSPPSHPDCRVVFFTANEDSAVIHFCKPDGTGFDEQDLGIDDSAFSCTATFGGKIYGTTLNRTELLVLDFDGAIPQVRILINQRPTLPRVYVTCRNYLVEFSGELFYVKQMSRGGKVHKFSIFRSDLSQNVWVEVKSIAENCAILLAPDGSSMCCTASNESGLKGNTIYFMECADRCIYSFNLKDQSSSINPPFPGASRINSKFQWIFYGS